MRRFHFLYENWSFHFHKNSDVIWSRENKNFITVAQSSFYQKFVDTPAYEFAKHNLEDTSLHYIIPHHRRLLLVAFVRRMTRFTFINVGKKERPHTQLVSRLLFSLRHRTKLLWKTGYVPFLMFERKGKGIIAPITSFRIWMEFAYHAPHLQCTYNVVLDFLCFVLLLYLSFLVVYYKFFSNWKRSLVFSRSRLIF